MEGGDRGFQDPSATGVGRAARSASRRSRPRCRPTGRQPRELRDEVKTLGCEMLNRGAGLAGSRSERKCGRTGSTMLTTEGVHSLHPFPDGWYLIAPAAQLRAGQLLQKTWMGQEIIAWRDDTGAVCVADALPRRRTRRRRIPRG
jgi:hypothetical protein